MAAATRREFLEQSMLAAAWAAVANAQPAFAQDAPAAGPDSILRVAVVGVNGRGASHIGGFGSRKDCEIAAIVDCDEAVANRKADDIEKRSGKRPKVYLDLRRANDDKELDVISIATPNHWHALAAIWAIQAGKDVYVEKPVSHNVSEGRRIVEAARKYKKIVQTGTQSRSNPGLRELMEKLHGGIIGPVNFARGLCYKPRGSIGPKGNYDVPASVNYDLWCGPAPKQTTSRTKFHYDWHWQWDFGNGDLGNQGIHQMDIARWGLQEMNLGSSVMSFGGRYGYEDAGETANTQVCDHRFGDGKRLVFEVRGLNTDNYVKQDGKAKVGVIFEGENGFAVVPSYTGGTVFDKSGKKLLDINKGGDEHHFANFVKAVRSRKIEDLNADILEGHLSSALCHVGNISYRLGQPTSAGDLASQLKKDEVLSETLDRFLVHLKDNKVDPDSIRITTGPLLAMTADETFSGSNSQQANAMLTREYRAPYIVPATKDL